jgi:hypothetical protein
LIAMQRDVICLKRRYDPERSDWAFQADHAKARSPSPTQVGLDEPIRSITLVKFQSQALGIRRDVAGRFLPGLLIDWGDKVAEQLG